METKKDFGKFLDEFAKKQFGDEELTPGRVIRASRKRFSMTLEELQEVTGIHVTNLSAIENDRIPMTSHYAETFAVAFGLHPSVILYPRGKFSKTGDLGEVEKKMKKYVKRLQGDGAA